MQRMHPIVEKIREYEAERGVKPLAINDFDEGYLSFIFEKTTLYVTDTHTLDNFDDSFDESKHSEKIRAELEAKESGETMGKVREISVAKARKLLPLPYFEIPTSSPQPGRRVRDRINLASQNTIVTLTLEKNISPEDALRLIKKTAIYSGYNDRFILPTTARRVSYNPIEWLLHGLSFLIPAFIRKKFNQTDPSLLVKASRPYYWGTRDAAVHLDLPFISYPTSAIFSRIRKKNIPIGPIITGENKIQIDLKPSRYSLLFQTKTKLQKGNHPPPAQMRKVR